MKKSQWFVLAFCFMFLGMFFINLDVNNGFIDIGIGNPCLFMENLYFEQYQNGEITQEEYRERISSSFEEPLDEQDVICAIGGEMYEPFIYSSYALFIFFLIMGFMEKKK